ncbi:MAG: hypothetical protein RMK29_10565 [Myxococcales bacterium]|nr:hypothetical protein [Myxococcota bacterium]MDW8282146.1 hypothetical protein [Myxococcales bacterium]
MLDCTVLRTVRCGLVALTALALACASPQPGGTVAWEEDLAAPADLGVAGDPQRPPDLPLPPDLAPSPDLPDLLDPPDLRPITGCSVVPQAGCPPGQKCTTHDALTTICDPTGMSLRGQSCTVMGGVDSCAAGHVCIDEGGGLSQCRAFCRTSMDCGDPRSFCDFALGATMAFRVCTQPCNAIYPGVGCSAGLACVAYGLERTDCQAPGPSDAGQPCISVRDCKGGMACIGPAGASVCRRICRRGDPSTCPAFHLCVDVQAGAFVWPTYGVCCLAGLC